MTRESKREWVPCPICGEHDMPKVWYEPDDGPYIKCTNLDCASNGGDNRGAIAADIIDTLKPAWEAEVREADAARDMAVHIAEACSLAVAKSTEMLETAKRRVNGLLDTNTALVMERRGLRANRDQARDLLIRIRDAANDGKIHILGRPTPHYALATDAEWVDLRELINGYLEYQGLDNAEPVCHSGEAKKE